MLQRKVTRLSDIHFSVTGEKGSVRCKSVIVCMKDKGDNGISDKEGEGEVGLLDKELAL
jgi:hypothetical protein